MLTRLRQLATGGRVLRGSEAHRFAVDRSFPVGCWCGRPEPDPVHQVAR